MRTSTAAWSPRRGWADVDGALDGPSTLVLAFCDSKVLQDPEPLQKLRECFPSSVVVGCSTAGEISGAQLLEPGISVGIARFEHARLKLAFEHVDDPTRSKQVGQALASGLHADGADLAGIFVLSDGISVNGTQLVAGLQGPQLPLVPVFGGLAGDSDRFERTWLFINGEMVSNAVVAVGIYGAQAFILGGHSGGWQDFGPERWVTKSQDNVLYELDGKPALELYRNYLGRRAGELPAGALLFPLAVTAPGQDHAVVRTIVSVDELAKSMTFAGDVPEGSSARLMRASRQELVAAAPLAVNAGSTHCDPATGSGLAIAISCVGRRLVLGDRTEDELESVASRLSPTTAIVGFYSYGEIATDGLGQSSLHNQTMTVALIGEQPLDRVAR